MGVGFCRELVAEAARALEAPLESARASWWRDAMAWFLGAPSPADRIMELDRRRVPASLVIVVDWRDRVTAALIREGYARPAQDNTLDVDGPRVRYSQRLGLVVPYLRANIEGDRRFSLTLSASRYQRHEPTLREGCPGMVKLVEETIGAKVSEQFFPV